MGELRIKNAECRMQNAEAPLVMLVQTRYVYVWIHEKNLLHSAFYRMWMLCR